MADELDIKLDTHHPHMLKETGFVISVIDGIVKVRGLENVGFGEIVEFDNSSLGLVLSIERNYVQVVLFGSEKGIKPEDFVKRRYGPLEIYVSFEHLGRIINSLGEFIDEKSIKDIYDFDYEEKEDEYDEYDEENNEDDEENNEDEDSTENEYDLDEEIERS